VSVPGTFVQFVISGSWHWSHWIRLKIPCSSEVVMHPGLRCGVLWQASNTEGTHIIIRELIIVPNVAMGQWDQNNCFMGLWDPYTVTVPWGPYGPWGQ